MEATLQAEMSATEVRERLVGFVGEVAAGLTLADVERRRKAKVPESVVFRTKPELAARLVERASGWKLPAAPILADCSYGGDTAFRTRLHALEREYVLAVSAHCALVTCAHAFLTLERLCPRVPRPT